MPSTMHFLIPLAISLFVVGAFAAPKPADAIFVDLKAMADGTTTTWISVTATVTNTIVPSSSSSSTASPLTSPTAAYNVISSRFGSPIHLLPLNAADLCFFLGVLPATYCPAQPEDCPPGNVTAFVGLGSLDSEVPGGQIVYVAPDGHLGYTQAHTAYYPPGSVIVPFIYTKYDGSSFGDISTLAFNAPGFMACPTASGYYQVFAALSNATVPNDNVSSCLAFEALTYDYSSSSGAAAWEYI